MGPSDYIHKNNCLLLLRNKDHNFNEAFEFPESQLKAITSAVLVMIISATGCSPWHKSNDEWSVSSGVATPLVSDSVANNADAPLLIEEVPPSTHQKAEEPTVKRKPNTHLGAQTLCSRGSDRRTLEVIRHRTGCRLSYQTRSRVENVAEATWGKKVCQQVRMHIVQKLKSAGYSCS